MNDCLFCKIVKGDIPCHKVWEDEKHIAFLDIKPINTGHTLLVPRKHEEYIFEIEDETYQDLWHAAKKLATHLKEQCSAEKVGIVIEGFEVPHSHIHLVPLKKAGELRSPPVDKGITQEDLALLADELRGDK